MAAAILAGAAGLLPMAASEAAAQVEAAYRISQRATISQRLGQTLVSLDYSRPLVRGRSELFGRVVHWGELWTPGANEATVLELSHDAVLEGTPVPAGRWSMWVIPSNVGPWEMVLDPADTLFHTQRPELGGQGQVRFALRTERLEQPVEALTWAFPRVAHDGATLEMTWATWRIPIEIAVESAVPVTTVAPEEAAPFVGEWRMTPQLPPGAPADAAPPAGTVRIHHADDGNLLFALPPGVFGPPPGSEPPPVPADASAQERERAEARRALAEQGSGAMEYRLVPRSRGVFVMGWTDEDGVLLDIEDVFHEFEFENGRAVRFVVRGPNDEVFATAERIR